VKKLVGSRRQGGTEVIGARVSGARQWRSGAHLRSPACRAFQVFSDPTAENAVWSGSVQRRGCPPAAW
jgi:hypothetical protein